jgi:hypothetical protein
VNSHNTPGAWSAVQKVTVSIPLDAPELTTPINNEIVAIDMPTFVWSSITGATYQIQVDDSTDFDDPILFDESVATATWTQDTAMADGDYYWRVRSVNSHNTSGAWSTAQKVTISLP